MANVEQAKVKLARAERTKTEQATTGQSVLSARHITVGYGDFVLMKDVSFDVARGEIFFVMGGSGCGKSTLLRVLMGLKEPHGGTVRFLGRPFWPGTESDHLAARRMSGVLFQGGALWSSMTLAENVALPLEQYTDLSPGERRSQARLKLALTGLAGFEDYYPSEISGGMRKRAGLARALALDPAVLFLDEPSAGLDPVSSRRLDELVLELRKSLGTTFVIVSHELASIFAIADTCIFLDAGTRSVTAHGNPHDLLKAKDTDPAAMLFLTRGDTQRADRGPGASGPEASCPHEERP